jgi:hypothetical protein
VVTVVVVVSVVVTAVVLGIVSAAAVSAFWSFPSAGFISMKISHATAELTPKS